MDEAKDKLVRKGSAECYRTSASSREHWQQPGRNQQDSHDRACRQAVSGSGHRGGAGKQGYRTREHGPIWIGQDEESTHRDVGRGRTARACKEASRGSEDSRIQGQVQGVTLLASPRVAVTDDTFQHRRMARDVDIVLVDATCPFGNGNVIPAGSMREPKSAFSRADILCDNQGEPG